MAPRFRNLQARQVIRAFERAGGQLRPGKGDHVNIKMPNGIIVTFMRATEVKIGVLRSALRKAGLSEEEFEGHLR